MSFWKFCTRVLRAVLTWAFNRKNGNEILLETSARQSILGGLLVQWKRILLCKSLCCLARKIIKKAIWRIFFIAMCFHNALRSKDEIHVGKYIGKIFRNNLEPEFSRNDILVSILRIFNGCSCLFLCHVEAIERQLNLEDFLLKSWV